MLGVHACIDRLCPSPWPQPHRTSAAAAAVAGSGASSHSSSTETPAPPHSSTVVLSSSTADASPAAAAAVRRSAASAAARAWAMAASCSRAGWRDKADGRCTSVALCSVVLSKGPVPAIGGHLRGNSQLSPARAAPATTCAARLLLSKWSMAGWKSTKKSSLLCRLRSAAAGAGTLASRSTGS